MSVRGFNTGAGVERYDYNALDNIPVTTNTRVKGDAESEYRTGNVNLTKANIGLGNVDNTSDAQKPVSNATQEALNSKVDKVTGKGLSTNDYTNAEKQKVDDAASQSDLDNLSRQISDETTGLDSKAPVIVETASGAIATFDDGADSMPIRKIVATIEPVQEGSGDSSPDNVRPISGWTGLNGKRAGENVAYFSNRTTTIAGITYDYADGIITANGTATSESLSGNTALYLNAGTYRVFNLAPQTDDAYILVQNTESSVSWITLASTSGVATDTFTLTRRTKVGIRARIPSGTTATDMVFKPVLVVGTEEPTKFEPYTGQNIYVNWQDTAGTVYRGTVTLNEDGSADVVSTMGNIASYDGETIPGAWISSMDVYAEGATPTTGAQVVYELAEPVSYHLNDVGQFKTVFGVNNIWTDVGSVTVEYSADTHKYISKTGNKMAINEMANSFSCDPEERELYKQDMLSCAASYLVNEINCTCVVGTPVNITDKPFVAQYNLHKGYKEMYRSNYDLYKFVYTDVADYDGISYPVVYLDCMPFAGLLTKCIPYVESPMYYAFTHIGNVDYDTMFNLGFANGNYIEKPYTFDLHQYYTTGPAQAAFSANHCGNRLYTLYKNGKYNSDVFDWLETGDILYDSYTIRNPADNYRQIGHIQIFIKTLDELNVYGGNYGVTFQPSVKCNSKPLGEHGYVIEVVEEIDGVDCIRVVTLDSFIESTKSFLIAIYAHKPNATAFNSIKATRCTFNVINHALYL